jgi:hypothetical protein
MVLEDKDPEKDKTQTAAGVPEKKWAVFGVRCSVFGVRCSVFGVRCSVFGVRCSVFGEASRGREPTGARVLRVWGW